MLEPIYYSRLRKEVHFNGDTEVAIEENELPSGFYFKILGYSKSGDFVLTRWREGQGLGYDAFGENLWKGRTPIDTDSGQIALPTTPPIPEKSAMRTNVRTWDRINSQVGNLGMTLAIAKALRDYKNYRSL